MSVQSEINRISSEVDNVKQAVKAKGGVVPNGAKLADIPEAIQSIKLGTDNYNELSNKPKINGHELSGNKSLTDLDINIPDVPGWALLPQKPSYSATEVGALPDDTVIPTKLGDLQNDKGYLTSHQDLPTELPANGGNSESVGGYKVKVLFESQYEEIWQKDENTLYFIK